MMPLFPDKLAPVSSIVAQNMRQNKTRVERGELFPTWWFPLFMEMINHRKIMSILKESRPDGARELHFLNLQINSKAQLQ